MTQQQADVLSRDRTYDSDRIREQVTADLMRKTRWAVLATLGLFVGLLLLFQLLRGTPGVATAVDWALLEGYTGLWSLSLLISGLVFALSEYRSNEVQQRLGNAVASFDIYTELYNRITDPEETAARRWIILNIEPRARGQPQEEWLADVKAKLQEKPDDWDQEMAPGHIYLKRALNTFYFIGFADQHYWNMKNELVEWMSPPIAKVWERIGPYVEQEAIERAEPDFYKAARAYGQHCLNWRRERGWESTIVQDGT